jgi:hypothetical protein
MKAIFILLVVYQLKYWLCDYSLQRSYMLRKFEGGTTWILPLCAHAGVHAAFTLFVGSLWAIWKVYAGFAPSTFYTRLAFALAALDFVVHFTVDRMKAAPTWGGRWKPNQPYFWWALGADQAAHHLTHYFIIFCLINS